MSHEKYKEWLRLAVADEINNDDMHLLKEHLAECGECRAELQELRQTMLVLDDRGVAETSEDMLWEARRNLHAVLEREKPALSISTRKTQSVAPRISDSPRHGWLNNWLSGFQLAFSGATAVLVGVFIGYIAFSGKGALTVEEATDPDMAFETGAVDQELGGPAIENVRFISRDAKTGEMEIQYDLVRPVRLRSDVEDTRMQRVLAYAVLNDDNAGTRLAAIDALDTHGKRVHDNDTKMALVKALRMDPNDGVRKHALEVLAGMPFDRDIKDACLYVLANDENPGLRVGAIDLLSKANSEGHVAGQEIYDFMNKELQSDKDAYLRARSTAFIQEVDNEQQQ